MGSRLESMQRRAKHLFLGKDGVVGVGVAGEPEDASLTFLLRQDLRQTKQKINSWAKQHEVAVKFLVTGPIRIGRSAKEE